MRAASPPTKPCSLCLTRSAGAAYHSGFDESQIVCNSPWPSPVSEIFTSSTTKPTGSPAGDSRAGQLSEGQLTLTVLLNRKRTLPDPDRPEDPLESTIAVKARMTVRADDKPPGSVTASAKPGSASRPATTGSQNKRGAGKK